ncbi:hypothetical protein TNCV_1367791 [Trichonephila clavipes]|nr:hypothetical protein TNCV_1367791 [Trichonephila clavipes]
MQLLSVICPKQTPQEMNAKKGEDLPSVGSINEDARTARALERCGRKIFAGGQGEESNSGSIGTSRMDPET